MLPHQNMPRVCDGAPYVNGGDAALRRRIRARSCGPFSRVATQNPNDREHPNGCNGFLASVRGRRSEGRDQVCPAALRSYQRRRSSPASVPESWRLKSRAARLRVISVSTGAEGTCLTSATTLPARTASATRPRIVS